MTNAKRSSSAKSVARSNESRAAADATPVASVVRRGAAACDALGLPAGRAAIVVACSGGSDSAATLHVVRFARPAARLIACYVDHGARPAASVARDLAAVRVQARIAGAKVAVHRLQGRPRRGASAEATMRDARYAALAACASRAGARHVVAGHQREDLAESALLALVRGSGIDGIAAMKPARPLGAGVDLVRPMLWASKTSLARLAQAAGMPVSVDETNADTSMRRNAVRGMLRTLESAVPGASRAIARSAVIAAGERALLEALAASAYRRCAAPDGRSMTAAALRRLPMPLLRRVLRFALKRATGSVTDFSYAQCAAVARAVADGRGGAHRAGPAQFILSAGRVSVLARPQPAHLPIEPKIVTAPRASRRVAWHGGIVAMRRIGAGSRKPRETARGVLRLDGSHLASGMPMLLRVMRSGDRIVPSGRRSAVSLSRFLAKSGFTREERAIVPLLCHKGAIAAVLGVRADARYAARPGEAVLEVRWTGRKAVTPDEVGR
jgi:tRNA(Ile)-lysidine synthase